MPTRPTFSVLVVVLLLCSTATADQFGRFIYAGETHYGKVSGSQIHVLQDNLFTDSTKTFTNTTQTDLSVPINQVQWLPPTDAKKVFAVGMNFASHRSSRASAPPPLFLKLPSSLAAHNANINLPKDSKNVHFEGELVLVIGKQAKAVSIEDAPNYIFGATIGNDLTERSWQRKDLQWLRAKASDGFGPVGPLISTDIDYNNVVLTTRLNGKVVQQENTRNMIHSPAKVVSYLSQYFTLEPGDLIFMGTPGKTKALKNGDVVSVSIEGIGTLSNTVLRGE